MRINHVAVYVADLKESKSFYEKYFGAVANEKYHNTKSGLQTYFLSFDSEVKLEIMSRPENFTNDVKKYAIGFTHLAFSVGSRSEVDKLTQRLEKDGYFVLSQARTTGDGYYESVVLDIDGNEIEITE